MNKTIWVFGMIAGLIISVFMVVSISICYSMNNFNGNMLVGYAAEIAAFSFVFVGIKNYRDKFNNGAISFSRAFRVGLLISLIASTMYTLAWVIDYHFFVPDFMDKFSQYQLSHVQAGGASAAQTAAIKAQMKTLGDAYKNPLLLVLYTYAEILPVGLILTTISALLLKKKPQHPEPGVLGTE